MYSPPNLTAKQHQREEGAKVVIFYNFINRNIVLKSDEFKNNAHCRFFFANPERRLHSIKSCIFARR